MDRIVWTLIISMFLILLVPVALGASTNDACFDGGCHDLSSSKPIDRVLYDSNPHKIIKCISCHTNSTDNSTPDHGHFIRQLNGSRVPGPGSNIGTPLLTQYSSQSFSLCYACHNETKLIGVLPEWTYDDLHQLPKTIVSSIGTNFINIRPEGKVNTIFWPANIHWDHLDDFGVIPSGKFDYNNSGTRNSYQSCPACHNVHGTNYPKMTKNDLAITYGEDSFGSFGYAGNSNFTLPGGDIYCDGTCHSASTTEKYYRDEINLFEDCVSCHIDNVDNIENISLVNKTAFSHGVHVNISRIDGNGIVNNNDCWTCHFNKDMDRINISRCEDCHVTGKPLPEPAPIIRTHLSGVAITSYSCSDCHSKVINNPGSGIVNVTSHYLKRPTISSVNYCDYCHGPNANSPFNATNKTILTFNHDKTDWNGNATCRTCHSNSSVSADLNATNTASFHDLTTELGDVYNRTTTTKADCFICHVQKSPQFVAAPTPPHDITGYNVDDCRNCHTSGTGTEAQKLHSVSASATGGCIPCHSNNETRYYANTSLFGRHANVNLTGGPNNVTDDDCKTCHFGSADGSMKMKLGAANSSNTYFCEACHTSTGIGPIHPSAFLINDLQHGSANCQWCHIAGDPLSRPLINENESLRYHPNGPKGTASGKGCLNCHYNPTPTELIFHAPLEKHETENCIDCHQQADKHSVSPDPNPANPPLVYDLSVTTPVSSGTDSQIQAIISDDNMFMAAARYQVTNSSGVVIDWTDMNPRSGFENVNASIDTSRLLGNYNVSVKGMAWAPKSYGGPYYPFNGQWSGIRTTPLNVTQAKGNAIGTVYGSLGNIAGAKVTTNTSISTTTNSTGFYSISLPTGTYVLTGTKEPQYYSNSVVVTVEALTTISKDILLAVKPTGTINGKVTNK